MGIGLLSTPQREKETEEVVTAQLVACVTAMQGWRPSMEDSHFIHMDVQPGVSIFGVFDGHGGKIPF